MFIRQAKTSFLKELLQVYKDLYTLCFNQKLQRKYFPFEIDNLFEHLDTYINRCNKRSPVQGARLQLVIQDLSVKVLESTLTGDLKFQFSNLLSTMNEKVKQLYIIFGCEIEIQDSYTKICCMLNVNNVLKQSLNEQKDWRKNTELANNDLQLELKKKSEQVRGLEASNEKLLKLSQSLEQDFLTLKILSTNNENLLKQELVEKSRSLFSISKKSSDAESRVKALSQELINDKTTACMRLIKMQLQHEEDMLRLTRQLKA